MSAKCFSEQFTATSLICSIINKFVTKPVHFILVYLLIICISLLKCFLLFCAFLSPPCHGSSVCHCCGSTRQSLSPRTVRMGRKDEDLEWQGLKVNELRAACQSLCQWPLQLCSSTTSSSMALLKLWLWLHIKPISIQLWKGKDFFDDLRYAPLRY